MVIWSPVDPSMNPEAVEQVMFFERYSVSHHPHGDSDIYFDLRYANDVQTVSEDLGIDYTDNQQTVASLINDGKIDIENDNHLHGSLVIVAESTDFVPDQDLKDGEALDRQVEVIVAADYLIDVFRTDDIVQSNTQSDGNIVHTFTSDSSLPADTVGVNLLMDVMNSLSDNPNENIQFFDQPWTVHMTLSVPVTNHELSFTDYKESLHMDLSLCVVDAVQQVISSDIEERSSESEIDTFNLEGKKLYDLMDAIHHYNDE